MNARRLRGTRSIVLAYQGALAVIAVATALALSLTAHGIGNLWATLGLAAAAVLAERGRVKHLRANQLWFSDRARQRR